MINGYIIGQRVILKRRGQTEIAHVGSFLRGSEPKEGHIFVVRDAWIRPFQTEVPLEEVEPLPNGQL